MLNKLIIGTANFTQPYGILSNGHALNPQEIHAIINFATEHEINEYDTAFAYGDLLSTFHKDINITALKITTKFSVKDNYKKILDSIKKIKKQYDFRAFYAILVHDPQNLKNISQKNLISFFEDLRQNHHLEKIGVSVYDLKDLENFASLIQPDIIQIPLNPLNQTFNNENFLNYIKKNKIEVQARSLFLQGILLGKKLPNTLDKLQPIWEKFVQAIEPFPSKLHALLSFAKTLTWVDKWVLGVSSCNNLKEIISTINSTKNLTSLGSFKKFKDFSHPLIDPRNWY